MRGRVQIRDDTRAPGDPTHQHEHGHNDKSVIAGQRIGRGLECRVKERDAYGQIHARCGHQSQSKSHRDTHSQQRKKRREGDQTCLKTAHYTGSFPDIASRISRTSCSVMTSNTRLAPTAQASFAGQIG